MVTIRKIVQIATLTAACTLSAQAALAADITKVAAASCHRAPPPLAWICSGRAPIEHPKMDPAAASQPYGAWGGSFGGEAAWTTKGGR